MSSKVYYENEIFENVKNEGRYYADLEFVDCTFYNCSLENCRFVNCNFVDCKFKKSKFVNLKFEKTVMNDGEFENCTLSNINWSLLYGGGYITPLQKIKNCILRYNNFLEINLSKFDFKTNEVTETMFADCILTGADFKNCNLSGTEFFKCNLTKSDFRNSYGYRIDITSNKLKGAKFSSPEVHSLLSGLGIIIE